MLLDFGASRDYSEEFVGKYVQIIKAASDGDRERVLVGSRDIGFLTGYESKVSTRRCAELTLEMSKSPRLYSTFSLSSRITGRKSKAYSSFR